MAKQKSIQIHKAPLSTPFLGISQEAVGIAASRLKLNGLRLYLYLACNKDGFEWSLNAVSYAEWLHIEYGDGSTPRKMIRDGIKDLLENGYLKQVKKDEQYEFFEIRPES